MTKEVLKQYRKLQIECLDLQGRIDAIENNPNETIVSDKVRGSSKYFPFTSRSFTIEGLGEDEEEHKKKLELKQALREKKKRILNLTKMIEDYIDTIQDSETRTIFRMHFFDGLSQEHIASKLMMAQSKVSERIKEQLREKDRKDEKIG